MKKNYKNLTESIKNNLNPDNIAYGENYNKELSTISYSDVLTYVRFAMKGVEPNYTQKTKEAGERVKQHLNDKLEAVTFEYQGSVMTNTHIKGHSDIDLLTICNKFHSYNSEKIKESINEAYKRRDNFSVKRLEEYLREPKYQGNSLEDLKKIRYDSENVLKNIYDICDITKPKAIKIENKALVREVDIVIAKWYKDADSVLNDKKENTGIQIFNKQLNATENIDFPFLSISRINEKNIKTNKRLKKMIRFLKNIKINSENSISISSFDINAICYDIEISKYKDLEYIKMVKVIYEQLKELILYKHSSLLSVDGREYIFREKYEKLEDLKLLCNEVEGILLDMEEVI